MSTDTPSFAQLFRVFGRIGVLSFGGPAAQIALMHKELVQERDWLSEDTFLRALSLCMLLPGPEAMQLATYAGWRLRGTAGGLIAGVLFVLPGAVLIAALAVAYAHIGHVAAVQAAFLGIKATVIIIVIQALLKVAGKALTTRRAWGLAGLAFLALFVFGVPFPVIILAAALVGALLEPVKTVPAPPASQSGPNPLRVIGFWASLWAAPVVVIAMSGDAFLLDVALFFSKLAVVTFGGAYAVLAYMTQTVVTQYDWISTAQMIDALGLAETTPGPLILVTQFVAMTAGFGQGGLAMAVAAGLTALWVTFIPCFLWIFLAGPYLDQIAQRPRIDAALRAITAAVVGVILNLAVWFALHVLFAQINTLPGTSVPFPALRSLNIDALGLTVAAAVVLLRFKRGMVETLIIMAAAGFCLSMI